MVDAERILMKKHGEEIIEAFGDYFGDYIPDELLWTRDDDAWNHLYYAYLIAIGAFDLINDFDDARLYQDEDFCE